MIKIAIAVLFFIGGFSYGVLFSESRSYAPDEVAVMVSMAQDACPLNGQEIAQLARFEQIILGRLK
jgi:hypothetical protein